MNYQFNLLNGFSQRLTKVADSAAASEIGAFLKREMRYFDSFINFSISTTHLERKGFTVLKRISTLTSSALTPLFNCSTDRKIAFGTVINQNIKSL